MSCSMQDVISIYELNFKLDAISKTKKKKLPIFHLLVTP